jgi:hypothetical protein
MIRYANFCATGEPESLSEAMHDPNWKQAMEEEFSALMKNGTWHLIPASQASNIIDCKWVYKVKRKADGTIDRHKARLVARGLSSVMALTMKTSSVQLSKRQVFDLFYLLLCLAIGHFISWMCRTHSCMVFWKRRST